METQNHRNQLLELIQKEVPSTGEYTPSSRKKSGYYIDLRLITRSAEGAYLLVNTLFDELKDEKIDALGGPTMGADPIPSTYASTSFMRGNPRRLTSLEKKRKNTAKQSS